MRSPYIVVKVITALIFMLYAAVVWLTIEDVRFNKKCVDAGGLKAGSICVNPSAIIEVE